jgi:hypothetical protein
MSPIAPNRLGTPSRPRPALGAAALNKNTATSMDRRIGRPRRLRRPCDEGGSTALPRSSGSPRLGGEIPLPHFEVSSFLAAAIGLLGFVSVCLLVFGRLGIGSIVAFLVAGLFVGMIRDLPDESVLALREFAELGVVLLLFLIGLEMKPSQLSSLGRDAISFGLPQIAVSAGVICVYAWLVLARWDTAIVLGLGFALSSTIVVVQILQDRDELHLSWGRKAFAILLAQDLAIVPLLLVVSLLTERGAGGGGGSAWMWASLRRGRRRGRNRRRRALCIDAHPGPGHAPAERAGLCLCDVSRSFGRSPRLREGRTVDGSRYVPARRHAIDVGIRSSHRDDECRFKVSSGSRHMWCGALPRRNGPPHDPISASP